MKRFIVVLTVILMAMYFVSCGGGGGGGSEPQTISPKNLTAKVAGIKVAFSPYDIDGNYTLDVSPAQDPEPLDGEDKVNEEYKIKMFNVSLNGKSDFKDDIKIVIPYDDTFIDSDSVEADNVAAMYFNPETNKYESEIFTVDTEKNEVTIYTNHLSQHGIAVFKSNYSHGPFIVDSKREYTRNARIRSVNPFAKVVDSETAQGVIRAQFDNGFTMSSGKAFQAGFGAANTWLGFGATGNTIVSSAFSSVFLKNLTNSFNLVGFGASVLQVGIDFKNGDDKSLYTNLLKNGVYNAVNYVGWGSLQLAFAGVFIIDYSLNTFATEAFNGNSAKWKAIYDCAYSKTKLKPKKHDTPACNIYKSYTKNTHANINGGWYSYIKCEILPDIKTPQRLLDVIETTIYNNTLDVWNDSALLGSCEDNVENLGGYDAAPKTKIALEKKAEVLESLKTVFLRIGIEMTDKSRHKYEKNLENVKDLLNKKVDFTITGASKYKGYSIRFADLNERSKADNWKGVISSGTIHTTFTYLGYLESGSPKKVEIFNPENDQVVKTILIGKISPVMLFDIHGEISSPVASPASGATFSNSLDVTLSSLDNADIYYMINDGDLALYNDPITLTDSATIYAYAYNDLDYNTSISDIVSFEYTKENTSTKSGKWVLYDKILINGCSHYDEKCYALKSCSTSEGSYEVTTGYNSCGGCDTCGGSRGSGTYTIPPSTLTPGQTIPFAVTATNSAYVSEGIRFYRTSEGLTFDESGSGSFQAEWSRRILNNDNVPPSIDYTIPSGLDKGGVLMISAYGSLGNSETTVTYYYLYKWQE